MMELKEGKLNIDLLKELLKVLPISSKKVKVKPGPGADAAVVDIGDYFAVITQDPITFTEKEIGYYSVMVNMNDVLCMGAKPLFYLFTLLIPKGKDVKEIKNIFMEISSVCRKYEISVIGGHTEITPGLTRFLISGTMIGLRDKKFGIFPKSVKEGDYLLCVKEVPIEGISIIAKEKEKELKKFVDERLLNKFKNYHRKPGIGIFREALLLLENKNVLALHDPTEGGIINGIYEFCEFLNLGVLVYEDKIKVVKKTENIFKYFGIEPLKTISSGALLAAVRKSGVNKVVEILSSNKIKFNIIGEFKKKSYGRWLVKKDGKKEEIYSCQDDISKIFD
ncbi:MAG: AIR synthase related protein [Candidatus Hydrothermales bacterium]